MNKNFISADKKDAINSYGSRFSVGETVEHDSENDEQAIIESFEINEEREEVKAMTSRGYAHIDFLAKIGSYATKTQ